MNRSRRHVCLLGEVVLGPSEGLSGSTNAVHGGISVLVEGLIRNLEGSARRSIRRPSFSSKCLIPLGVLAFLGISEEKARGNLLGLDSDGVVQNGLPLLFRTARLPSTRLG